jgi:Domain of unknown function (DUF4129)
LSGADIVDRGMVRQQVTGEPADRDPGVAGRPATSRVVPVVLLAALVLLGLRAGTAAPRWDGPLHTRGTVVGLVLEAVLAILLAATVVRGRRTARRPGPDAPTVARLQGWLRLTLGGGMAAVAIVLLVNAHLHLFTKRARPRVRPSASRPSIRPGTPHPVAVGSPAPIAPVLYGLLIAVLVAAVVLGLVWVLRHRRPVVTAPPGAVAEDSTDLQEAVASGRAALREVDDARAAIIACYVAMERSLAEAGTARAAADTPDELLARATASGILRGDAAARLTGLFYEARFSSHPLDQGQRDQAARALDDLAAELRAAEARKSQQAQASSDAGDAARAAGAQP